jgi:hypothetical protein
MGYGQKPNRTKAPHLKMTRWTKKTHPMKFTRRTKASPPSKIQVGQKINAIVLKDKNINFN